MASKVYNMTFDNGKDKLVIGAGTEYGIVSYEGFDNTNIDVELKEYQFDGGKITRQRIGSRAMSVHFHCKQSNIERKFFMEGFFSPHKPGTITVNNQGHYRQASYIVTSLEDKQENLHSGIEFELQMKSPEGYFADPDYTLVEMNSWEGGFTLPSDLPFSLRHRGIAQKVIINEGQADTPVWVRFQGPATSPKVSNVTTGLHVQVATSLTEGQTLHIKTDENRPEVLIEENGMFTNGYPLITDATSLEMRLVEGDNLLKYESADANQINQVNVLYKNRYLGV